MWGCHVLLQSVNQSEFHSSDANRLFVQLDIYPILIDSVPFLGDIKLQSQWVLLAEGIKAKVNYRSSGFLFLRKRDKH